MKTGEQCLAVYCSCGNCSVHASLHSLSKLVLIIRKICLHDELFRDQTCAALLILHHTYKGFALFS